MFILGITGGIGSGKTLVCKVLQTFGAAIFSADDQVKRLYEEDEAVKAYVVHRFGASVYVANRLQTKVLAQIVFKDKAAMEDLNRMIYPVLWRKFERWQAAVDGDFAVMDAALLCESGFHEKMMFIANVYAPKNLRIERILRRNPDMNEQDIEQRMQFQWTDAQRRRYADCTIINDGNIALLPQILSLHAMLKARRSALCANLCA
jgi:dephospho-CoA kinase